MMGEDLRNYLPYSPVFYSSCKTAIAVLCYNLLMTTAQRATILWTISFVFFTTGVLKLLGNQLEVRQFAAWGYPLWFMYATGVINILAAIGLQIEKYFYCSAICLILLLATALTTITLRHQGLGASLPPLVLIVPLVVIVFLKKRNYRRNILR
jgi:hypothetical protein